MKRRKKLIASFGLFALQLFAVHVLAQQRSVEEIKKDPAYLWGEAEASNLRRADQEAVAMLSEQISVTVESMFELLKESEKSSGGGKKGADRNSKEKVQSMVRTHSRSTLKNTEQIKREKDGSYYVFRFIKREDVDRIFEDRRLKAEEFALLACKAEGNHQVAEALQYYYWALGLLSSHPDGGKLRFVVDFKERNMTDYLRSGINRVLNDLSFRLSDETREDGLAALHIQHTGVPVRTCDFRYSLGSDWSEVIGAKDGCASIETHGQSINPKDLRFRVEYAFENQWHIDEDVCEVMEQLEPLKFEKYQMPITSGAASTQGVVAQQAETTSGKETNSGQMSAVTLSKLVQVNNPDLYLSQLRSIETAIRSKNILSVRSLFEADGWEMFRALMGNGEARITATVDYRFIGLGEEIIARALPMRFKFKSNNRTITEDVVFHFTPQGKVSSLAFALSNDVVQEIMNRDQWSEEARLNIVHFLETYQTAYALKRSDFLESIFDENALIIVGHMVKPKHNDPEMEQHNRSPIVKTTRLTKSQYLNNLKNTFRSNEFINLRFTDSEVKESQNKKGVFGIRLRQNYYSSNYGDTGWLFLLVDLTQPGQPTIYVRVWQEEKDPEMGWAVLDVFR